MSRAFVKEPDGDVPDALLERPVSQAPNLVTPAGFAAIEREIARLDVAHAAAVRADDKTAIAAAQRDLRYWTARRISARIVESSGVAAHVHFGGTVTIVRADGRQQTFRIVGEDEADPKQGTLSHTAPLASALLGKAVGDVVDVAGGEAEILEIK